MTHQSPSVTRIRFSARAALLLALAATALSPVALAQDAAKRNIEVAPDEPGAEIVELPRYTVTDERILPPPESWRHATLPGYEILSNARDSTTQAFLKDFQQLQASIAIVWPTLVSRNVSTPTLIILCARGNAFRQFIPEDADKDVFITPTSIFVEDKERGAIVIDFALQEIFDGMELLGLTETALEMVGDTLDDETSVAGGDTITETSSNTGHSDPYGEFYRQYSRFLLRRANGNKPIPEWLEEGLSRLFATLDFRKKWIEFGKVEEGFRKSDGGPDISTEGAAMPVIGGESAPAKAQDVTSDRAGGRYSSYDRRTRHGAIYDFRKMFDPESAPNLNRSLWSNQCFAFVHMCLYGMNKKYQKPFLDFAKRACLGPVDENDFKQCFNKNYKQMATMLSGHISSLSQESVRFEAKKGSEGLPDPVKVELREATQAEIGRIKGEALRLAGHADASRETLVIPYLRKERDAGLLASLGLLEALEQRHARARKFLEAAAKENVVRPRAYAELARLRLNEALAAPASPDGRLSAAQAAGVLEPLFIARKQPPPMEDVYSLIGQTWLHGSVVPREANLKVVLEGAVRFPKNVEIVHCAATLYTLHGDKTVAKSLVNLGLKISPDQQTRKKFEELRAMLE